MEQEEEGVVEEEEEEEEEEERGKEPAGQTHSRAKTTVMTTYTKGDIVAAVEKRSTAGNPQILLGKVLSIDQKRREVLLAWLKPVTRQAKDAKGTLCYKMVVGKDTWKESMDAVVHPIDIITTSRPGVYQLNSSLRDIHNAVKLK